MRLEGKKILVVEDDNFIGDMLVRKLDVEGAICTKVSNGEEGLAKLKEKKYDFDIILADVMMKKMDGYEMVQEIKKDPLAESLPIIVLTNKNSETPQMESITELGIQGMYIKSSTPLHELVRHITEAIESTKGVKSEGG